MLYLENMLYLELDKFRMNRLTIIIILDFYNEKLIYIIKIRA